MFSKSICLVCILLQMSYGIDSSNILGLFTSPHKSHMLVYIGVIKSLLKRGHTITIITVLPVEDIIISSDIQIIQLKKPPEPYRVHGIFRQIAVIAANSKLFYDPRFHKFLREDYSFDLVILGYLFNDYQLGVAAHFNCPSVVIWTTQPISFVNKLIGNPNGWSYVPQPFIRSQAVGLRGIFYGVFDTIFKWIVILIMDYFYRELFPSPKYPPLADLQNNVSLVVCNHHFSEGPIAAHLPSLIEISGIQIEKKKRLTEPLKDFMNAAKGGVIYFSLGSVVSPKRLNDATLKTFYKVFSSIPQRVIWKIDSISQNSTNIFTGKWFPQSAILGHPNTKLFITHGGKGSTTEALYYAVPMIAIPIFGDQFGDASRLEAHGFGLKLESDRISEFLLRNSISELLNNNTYANNIKSASQIFRDRPSAADQTAVHWIEYVIRHRGAPQMQTPKKLMNTIQYLNIDIYLFLLCFSYAVVSAMKIIVFTIYIVLERLYMRCW